MRTTLARPMALNSRRLASAARWAKISTEKTRLQNARKFQGQIGRPAGQYEITLKLQPGLVLVFPRKVLELFQFESPRRPPAPIARLFPRKMQSRAAAAFIECGAPRICLGNSALLRIEPLQISHSNRLR